MAVPQAWGQVLGGTHTTVPHCSAFPVVGSALQEAAKKLSVCGRGGVGAFFEISLSYCWAWKAGRRALGKWGGVEGNEGGAEQPPCLTNGTSSDPIIFLPYQAREAQGSCCL